MSTSQNQIAITGQRVWERGKHIPQLDGVRGLAILIVTLYRFSKELPTDTWIGKFLHSAFVLGDRGVDLFFVLSGFLITGILLDAREQSHYFKNFFLRRSLRIFPLYFFALFLFLFVVSWFHPHHEMFAQAREKQFFLWTYLANVKMSLEGAWCFGYLDHFWSLAVEEHFYLVWPFVIFFLSPRASFRLAIFLAVASALSRIGFAALGSNGVAPDVLTLFRCDALLIGSLLAMRARMANGFEPWKRWSLPVFAICITAGLGFSVLQLRAFTISHTLWPLAWACTLIWLLTGKKSGVLARFFNLVALRKLGKYSYAMYVFQSPLIPLAAGVFSVPVLIEVIGNPILANLLYIALMFGLTYGAALLSWYCLERHFARMKELFGHPAAKPSGLLAAAKAKSAPLAI